MGALRGGEQVSKVIREELVGVTRQSLPGLLCKFSSALMLPFPELKPGHLQQRLGQLYGVARSVEAGLAFLQIREDAVRGLALRDAFPRLEPQDNTAQVNVRFREDPLCLRLIVEGRDPFVTQPVELEEHLQDPLRGVSQDDGVRVPALPVGQKIVELLAVLRAARLELELVDHLLLVDVEPEPPGLVLDAAPDEAHLDPPGQQVVLRLPGQQVGGVDQRVLHGLPDARLHLLHEHAREQDRGHDAAARIVGRQQQPLHNSARQPFQRM